MFKNEFEVCFESLKVSDGDDFCSIIIPLDLLLVCGIKSSTLCHIYNTSLYVRDFLFATYEELFTLKTYNRH